MKKILFSLIFASACIGATAQEEWKEVISRQDTLINIPDNSAITYYSSKKWIDRYSSYDFFTYDDHPYYVLEIGTNPPPGMCVISINIASWGRYRERGDMLYLTDGATGIKMKVRKEGNKVTFLKEYFPSLDRAGFEELVIDDPFIDDSSEGLWVFCDKKKAAEKRREYAAKTKGKTINFELGRYYGSMKFYEDKTWTMGRDSIKVFEGKWKRKGNILTLKPNGYRQKFHMLILDGELISMLLPGDTNGSRYWLEPMD